jgi:hypothetical protein
MITKQQTSTQQSLVCRIAIVLSISILLYFLVSEAIAMAIQPGYSVVIGGYNIIRGMLFALAGLEMADFCERRRDDTTPTTMLHISRAALSVSGVAVVFTNQHKSVVWLNAAFALFMNAATNHSSLLNVSLEDLLRPSSDNAQKLNQCFRTTGTSEADILVRGKIVHVTVMAASTAASEEPSFVVELHDVTEQRSLEWFMQSSQEAMCGEITSGTRTTSRDQR